MQALKVGSRQCRPCPRSSGDGPDFSEWHPLKVAGPDVNLPPQIALHVALMLHELGTNAAKYGALSASAGTVEIRWLVRDGRLALNWTERNGPPVTAPSRRGFGSTLIERTANGNGGSR